MKPFGWINKAVVLALTVGLTGASCATHRNAVLSKNELLPPPLNNSPYAEPCTGVRVRKVEKAERSALR